MSTRIRALRRAGALAAAMTLGACGGDNTPSPVEPPGAQRTATSAVLEAGAAVLQEKAPLEALNSYLDGFHFYSGNMQGQMEAHHYCSMLNEDVTQCVIYDGNTREAKLMGVEYIVSEALFRGLPPEEKHLWHSHVHEVRSGTLIAPGIPEVAERELMQKIAGTYGKTWHTWHTDMRDQLPVGHPMLMMAFTQDGQLREELLTARDERFGVSAAEKREERAQLSYPEIDAEADAWQKGVTMQLQVSQIDAAPAQ
jgi:hypothetical protein